MDRAEVIAALREAYRTGGMSALAAACDAIRQHGQIHTPEFFTCVVCGGEFEPPVSAELNSRNHPLRCANCRTKQRKAP